VKNLLEVYLLVISIKLAFEKMEKIITIIFGKVEFCRKIRLYQRKIYQIKSSKSKQKKEMTFFEKILTTMSKFDMISKVIDYEVMRRI